MSASLTPDTEVQDCWRRSNGSAPRIEDVGDRLLARLKRSDGALEMCEAAYLAGCDGASSTVREALQIGFPGGT
jgi:2-polyprenyl-6-methoxyphenol hydroxylase-like FAD-dependent oxidoreductase